MKILKTSAGKLLRMGNVSDMKLLTYDMLIIKYGAFYNWYAGTDSRNLANTGWHVPSWTDHATLQTSAQTGDGNSNINNNAAYKLKTSQAGYWRTGWEGSDAYGFNLKGAGRRVIEGGYTALNLETHLLTSTGYTGSACFTRYVIDQSNSYSDYGQFYNAGFSVRLVKDDSNLPNNYVGNDGKVYKVVKIGNQVWMADNLAETKYRNGDSIPLVTGTWSGRTEGAMAYYNDDISYAY